MEVDNGIRLLYQGLKLLKYNIVNHLPYFKVEQSRTTTTI